MPKLKEHGVAAARPLRSTGRRKGHGLSLHQERLLLEAMPRLRLDLEAPPPSPLTALFARAGCTDIWLEIGFGGAEHLLWQAERHPLTGLIGCEPFVNGVVKALAGIQERDLANVRLHDGDAREVAGWLPEASVGRVFILFADPWPKKRHHKRRLISPITLDLLARIMRPGAELRFATDSADYARAALGVATRHPSFKWQASRPADWRERSADWPPTRYEQKAKAAGRRPVYLRFTRT